MASASESSSSVVTKTIKTSSSSEQVSGSSSGSRITSSRQPITSSKPVIISRTRTSVGTDNVDSMSSKRATKSYGSMQSAMNQGVQDVSSMLNGRQQEKRQMQELNERLASYIEKVRFLEAQNRKLSGELQKLRDSWGKETEKVKEMYETELEQMRRLLKEADQYKGEAEVKISSLEEQLSELQLLLDEANRQHSADSDAVEKLTSQMAEYDSEISLLRRRAENFDRERARDQAEIKRLRQEVQRLRADLDVETLQHINSENAAQSLREQIEFLKAVHESELKELSALAYRDTTQENREYWKNEMSSALREIQSEFESKLETVRSEVESQYSIRMQEVRTSSTRDNMELTHLKEENKRIKSQVGDAKNRIPELEAKNSQMERELLELRREMEEAERESEMQKGQLRADLSASNSTLEEYLRELQSVMDAKLSLELEIHAYRKLLESEETRIVQTKKTTETRVTESSESSEQQKSAMQQIQTIQNQITANTTNQRSAKGNVRIRECSEDGNCLILENTGNKREDISEWVISRDVDSGSDLVEFTFGEDIQLDDAEMKVLYIWAADTKPEDAVGPANIEADEVENWGVGALVVTTLTNTDGEERATLTQKTTFSNQ